MLDESILTSEIASMIRHGMNGTTKRKHTSPGSTTRSTKVYRVMDTSSSDSDNDNKLENHYIPTIEHTMQNDRSPSMDDVTQLIYKHMAYM